MKCQDFKRGLNDRLDARGAALPGTDRALDEHALTCAECRAVAGGYRTLGLAILALGPPPSAPEGFADRFLERREVVASRPARLPWGVRRVAWPVAAAASILVAVLIGLRAGRVDEPRPEIAAPGVVQAIDPRMVTDALADATSAAWELARETSAPATRIGRDMLDSAVAPEAVSPEEVVANPDVLQIMEDRVNDSVRPLSGTARHAFEFLLGPAAPAREIRGPT